MDRLIPMLGRAEIAVVLLTAGAGMAQNKQSNGMTSEIPGSLPNIHLVSPVADGQWTMQPGDYGNLRYSPLSQINTQNAHNLHVVANMSDGIPHGHEGGPLVVGSTLYMVTPFPNNLIAFDLSKPEQHFPMKWKYEPHPNIESVGVACCDTVNRGPMYADGKIIYALLDNHVVAVDATSGKEVWRTQVGDIHFGETVTMAPLVVKDTVFVGNSGGEMGVRGKLTALDLKSSKIKWVAYSTGSDQDVRIGPDFKPFYAKDQGKDLGLKTWNPGQWKIGGGTIWGWISYDPQLNLIYYGTGNPGPWNPDMRPGDNKWTCAIIARDADTGMAKWAWQGSPHDEWDYDEIMENILVDMPWHG